MSSYLPDVQDWLVQGERNYRRIMRIFPDLDRKERRAFSWVGVRARGPLSIELKVTQRSKYTASLELMPQVPQASDSITGTLHIRLYHDAGVAEVVQPGPKQIMQGVYPYPNAAMYQVDEKAQLNQLLSQWLTQCERFAHTVVDQVGAD